MIINLDKKNLKRNMNTQNLVKDGMGRVFGLNKVHVNGNVTVNVREDVTERLNIRRIKPYKPPSSDP